MSIETAKEKTQLMMDIIHAHMTGNDEFHRLMEISSKELTLTEYNYVKDLIGEFPKHFSNCTEVMYQLLSTIAKIRGFSYDEKIDVPFQIVCIEVKEHAPWS